jgi:hypothetical protein
VAICVAVQIFQLVVEYAPQVIGVAKGDCRSLAEAAAGAGARVDHVVFEVNIPRALDSVPRPPPNAAASYAVSKESQRRSGPAFLAPEIALFEVAGRVDL